jgi:hypothetical protein
MPVPTARSGADYGRKAAHTAEEVRSAVTTARIAVESDGDGKVLPTTLDVIVTEAEGDASGAAETFTAIQPKGRDADATRERLLDLLDDAESTLAGCRIAVRRDDRAELRRQVRPLHEVADALEAFAEEVG